ncbi:MAG: hypothetical protein LBQ61_01155 [Spirochaetales bacterium]|jgi:hypothetical protein|nr:hypothetical protein [Spirochaetales bacterium]
MNQEIPAYVDNVLQDWESISFYAYDKYEAKGRGTVVLFEENGSAIAGYCTKDYYIKNSRTKEITLIENYNPADEFLLRFETGGGWTTLRIGFPEGGRSPKEVWFYKTLQKINESRPPVPPKDLPGWFLEALEKIESPK